MLKSRITYKNLKQLFKYLVNFGPIVTYNCIVLPSIKKRAALPYKHKAIKNYLYNWGLKYTDFKDVAKIILDKKQIKNPNLTSSPIWVCWLQGEEKMPKVINLCYESIKRNANNHSVVLITFDNLESYVKIPASISDKLNKGEISFTHFADYLRILLLKEYGGLWIDSSIYVTQNIKIPTNLKFYSIKSRKINDTYVSDYRWTVSLIGSDKPHNPLFVLLELLMRKYIEDHKKFIDFFLMDYLIAVIFEHNDEVKKMIDCVPINNELFYEMNNTLNLPYNEEDWNNLKNNQVFHKLSWKQKYFNSTDKGEETLYSIISKRD